MGLSFAAPLAGRDRPARQSCRVRGHFNPRAPCGARRYAACAGEISTEFQSTRPLRGATFAGCRNQSRSGNFNPRTPCGVRRNGQCRHHQRLLHFNPRTPCGVRPWMACLGRLGPRISIHAPLAGRDMSALSCRIGRAHFNPRAPCGVRLEVGGGIQKLPGISIHAPLAGCDLQVSSHASPQSGFQSTHPLRGATTGGSGGGGTVQFQSTHPLRGATALGGGAGHLRRISIHAPLAGCDAYTSLRRAMLFHFNPRTPCGVRPFTAAAFSGETKISIHAPLAGCDDPVIGHFDALAEISIHAPLAGCDRQDRPVLHAWIHFNPRTPCGVRLRQSGRTAAACTFQSTHPLRGATAKAHKKMRHFCAKGINTSSLCAKNAHPAT